MALPMPIGWPTAPRLRGWVSATLDLLVPLNLLPATLPLWRSLDFVRGGPLGSQDPILQ